MKLIAFFFGALMSLTVMAKDIRLIVPYVPGGPADRISRLLQAQLANTGVRLILDYRVGAGGAIGFNHVAQQRGTETVLLLASNGLTDGPSINPASNYNLSQDFRIVKHLGTTPMFLVVAESNPAKSFKELVAQSDQKIITYGSSGVGSGQHISAALVTSNYKNFQHIPYKGGGQALMDVLGGTIAFVMESDMVIDPYVKSNKLRPLAVISPARVPGFESVPTFQQLGIQDYNYTRWFMILSNSTADPKITNLIEKILSTTEVQSELKKIGLYPPTGPVLDSFLTDQHRQFQRIQKIVKIQ